MSEQALIDTLLRSGVKFPWQTSNKVKYLTEVQITTNRVDVVYFEEKDKSEVGHITAIEAKVRNWRRALQQAYRDKLFADSAYVVLPEKFSATAISNLSEFKRASVGLMVVGSDGVKSYFDPPINNWRSEYHVNLAKKELLIPEIMDAEENLARPEGVVDVFQLTSQKVPHFSVQKLLDFANSLPHLS